MEPRVHATIIEASVELGGAATVTARLDSYGRPDRPVNVLSRPVSLTFFCPNYEPKELKRGDEVWIQFEAFADWEDLKESTSREEVIQPLKDRRDPYEYSMIGEIFRSPRPGGSERVYINAVIPILLTLGYPVDPKTPSRVANGRVMRLAKGRLYGDIELWDPELRPKHHPHAA